jgi:hypothetical protein
VKTLPIADLRLPNAGKSLIDKSPIGNRQLFELIVKGLTAGESGIGLVPPIYFILVRLPAQIDNSAVAIVWKIDETRTKILKHNAKEFDLLNRLAESDQVSKISGAERASAATFARFFSGEVDLNAHIQQRLALAGNARKQFAQPRYQTPGFAQSEHSYFVSFFVVHL